MSRKDKNILQYAIGLYVNFLTSALLKNHKCKTIQSFDWYTNLKVFSGTNSHHL